jgi:hypothetical protein
MVNPVHADDFSVDWLFDGQVIVYRLLSSTQSSLNAWSQHALATLETWPKDRPYRAVHDVSQPGLGMLYYRSVQNDVFNVGVLPAARPQVEALLKDYPDWSVSLALLVSGSVTGQIVRSMPLHYAEQKSLRFHARTFLMRPQALDWLMRSQTAGRFASNAFDRYESQPFGRLVPMVAYKNQE